MDTNDLQNRFTFHASTPETAVIYESVRMHARDFAMWLNDRLPESREKSLAITHLEEVVYWANASVARN